MAKYLILIYGDEQQWAGMSERERLELEAGHAAFRAAAGDRVLDGQELEAPGTATTLRLLTTTDGPFLETKEALGGYYLLQAADLDEVITLAGMLPEVAAGHSGVEIRPVRDHG